jgi:glycerophosphoryl diester phosphodiesterase
VSAAPVRALPAPVRAFDLQGHRGARGLWPENTLAAFAGAIGLGVDTLELDCGMTRDGVVVVLHDRRVPATLCPGSGTRAGRLVSSLTLEEVRSLGCGGRGGPAGRARVPTLAEVYALAAGTGVRLAVELKLDPRLPGDTAGPERFVGAVLAVAAGAGMLDRTALQSFDWRVLVMARRLAPAVRRVALAERPTIHPGTPWTAGLSVPADVWRGPLAELALELGAHVLAPEHTTAGEELVAAAHAVGLPIVPWTVNDPADMAALLERGVDGLITDRPDLALDVLGRRALAA